jgi:hypothetical protein
MAKYTISYGAFLARLNEVELLRQSAAKKERSDPIGTRAEIDALCRASIVLLSSHVEAYIREVGEVALQALYDKEVDRHVLSLRTFYHISKDVIDELKDTSDHIKIAEKVFAFLETDGRYWARVGALTAPIPSERFNKGFSNPKFDKIKAYFNRFGYNDYKRDFYAKLRADAVTTQNMLDHLVDIRNSIAHGDPSATKTPQDLKEMTATIVKFCRTTDELFGNWCRTSLCPIR